MKILLLGPYFVSDEHILYFLIKCELLNFILKTIIVYISSVTSFLSIQVQSANRAILSAFPGAPL